MASRRWSGNDFGQAFKACFSVERFSQLIYQYLGDSKLALIVVIDTLLVKHDESLLRVVTGDPLLPLKFHDLLQLNMNELGLTLHQLVSLLCAGIVEARIDLRLLILQTDVQGQNKRILHTAYKFLRLVLGINFSQRAAGSSRRGSELAKYKPIDQQPYRKGAAWAQPLPASTHYLPQLPINLQVPPLSPPAHVFNHHECTRIQY